MRHNKARLFVFAIAVLSASIGQLEAEEKNLGEMLSDSRWDRLIGTWVDENTKGTIATTTYAWKYKGHAIESTSKMGDLSASALIGRNADSGEVFHMGVDSKGGSSLGKWTFDADEAVLELGFTSAEGQLGGLKIKHLLKDDNTLIVTIYSVEPITLKMILNTN